MRTALSGPAGGVAGAFALASAAGFERIITLDMGGTSTDVALCPGRILERDETIVGGLPVRGPDRRRPQRRRGRRLDRPHRRRRRAARRPRRARAQTRAPPATAAAREPTVTDAHVVLGRIAPEQFLGGRMAIEPELSVEALKRIAAPFGGDPHRAAAAVLRVANANMEGALRLVSVERGHDPRGFTLVAFGGAGPLHACDLAAALRIPRVLIPPHPGVLSALGMATAPVVKDLSAAVMLTIGGDTARRAQGIAPLRRARNDLESRGRKELATEGFSLDGMTVETFLEMRYAGQSYELTVPVESLVARRLRVAIPRCAPRAVRSQRSGPHRRNRHAAREARAAGRWKSKIEKSRNGSRLIAAAIQRTRGLVRRQAASRRRLRTRRALSPGATLRGPAVVVQMDSTTAVPPGWGAEVDAAGNLVLEIA